ncbi:hypothetical protein GW796_08300 [archaeon]|nr:hypothetical protein [archaeon]
MPSNNYMKNKGVSKEEGVAIEMQPSRHTQTRTYGNNLPKSKINELKSSYQEKYKINARQYN